MFTSIYSLNISYLEETIMAEAQINCNEDKVDMLQQKDNTKDQNSKCPNVLECAVCLQNCIHPARLPCNHVFCYLCIKGVANQSKRCPMCRQEIPADFLEKPQLLETTQMCQKEAPDIPSSSEEYYWFYEGKNGWWQYDQRTSMELEAAYKDNKTSCELLVAGFLYIADFNLMIQCRRNDHSRKRRIKRDLCNAPKKGIAGLRLVNFVQPSSARGTEHVEQVATHDRTGNSALGQTSHTPDENIQDTASASTRSSNDSTSSFYRVLEQMQSLVLRDNLDGH